MRRLALLSLSAAMVMASSAVAQEQPAPAPAAEPAPAAQAAPVQDGVAPTPPPAEAPATPPPPPPAPTDVTSVAILGALDRVCRPLVAGGNLEQLAKANGFKKKREMWSWAYAKGYQMTLLASTTNPNVCTLEIDYPIDGLTPVIVDLHNWAMARQWALYRNDKYTTDMERSTRSWELRGETQDEAVVLMSVRKADGTPVSKKADRAEVLYSLTKR
ncbi:hypothetical protein [Caulobacter mirabilis]|uniref:DUF3558 domain-containing protein n=1 Tax=Caulobacter mirabilis TaxID=69666 RepID=A0A2D2AT67_9CAUL|nr:hypothetical protein [Caulobacter mirabilis]ATQ41208.1 hypothetical protein CSW64_01665 [Caulobacter mirabilis]